MLEQRHYTMLHADSAISDEVIESRGYRTIPDRAELTGLGDFSPFPPVPGLLLPLCHVDGTNGTYIYRPDSPACYDNKKKGKLPDGTYPQEVRKYIIPKGWAMRVDCPPVCQPRLGDPAIPLWITEGQKKADALASTGECAIALLGVWNFKGKNAHDGSTVLADFDHIAWKATDGAGREVYIVFDSDMAEKPQVMAAAKRLTPILRNRGANVEIVLLPPREDGGKQGVDDYLAAGGTIADLLHLANIAKAAHAAEGTTKRLKSGDYIKVFQELGLRFAMNEMDDSVEVNGLRMTDARRCVILTALMDKGITRKQDAEIVWTKVAHDNRYHPIQAKLEALAREWDGYTWIDKLATYFDNPDDMLATYLTRWLVGCVAKVFEHGQNSMIVIDGPQGIGKSYLFEWLAMVFGEVYLCKKAIRPDNKDDELAAIRKFVWLNDELGATTRRQDVEALKSFVTSIFHTVRPPYGRDTITKPQLANFCATINGAGGFLTDRTGNRRFMVCRVEFINWDYAKNINPAQVWAEAVNLYKQGEPWRLTTEEAKAQEALNQGYLTENPVEELVKRLYRLHPGRQDYWQFTSDIIERLRENGAGNNPNQIAKDLGVFLAANGHESSTRRLPNSGSRARGWYGLEPVPTDMEESQEAREKHKDVTFSALRKD